MTRARDARWRQLGGTVSVVVAVLAVVAVSLVVVVVMAGAPQASLCPPVFQWAFWQPRPTKQQREKVIRVIQFE